VAESLLARLRRTAGLTQEELAERSGLTARGIRSLERGTTKRPRQHSLDTLAAALGLAAADRVAFIAHYRGHAADVGVATPGAGLPVRPAQLPAAPLRFTGRTAHLDRLDELRAGCASSVVTVTLDGLGGVGKTALATHWAHLRRAWFPDGQLYANLRGFGPLTPAEPVGVLAHFLRSLGVAPEQIPADLNECSALFRSLLADRKMLVLLDNVRAGADARPLLPGTAGSMVLITSRDQLRELSILDGAHRMPVDPLDDSDATSLFDDVAGAALLDTDREAATAIVAHCAGLPLALAVAANRVGGEQDLAAVAAQLADGAGLGLGHLDDEAADVESVFSWSVAALDDDTARLFRLLGLHPGPEIGVDATAALLGSTADTAGRLLGRLADARLLEERRPGRFELHDLLRLYAARLADSALTAAARDDASTRVLDYYLHTALAAADMVRHLTPERRLRLDPPACRPTSFEDRKDALAWLEAELPNVLAVAEAAVDRDGPPYTVHLAHVLYEDLFARAEHHAAVALHSSALTAARRQGSRPAEYGALADLALAYGSLAQLDLAAEHTLEAARLAREYGDRVVPGRALRRLGIAHAQVGHYREAAGWFQRAFDTATEDRDDVEAGRALNSLGIALQSFGQYDEALETFEKSLTIARGRDEITEVFALTNVGDGYRLQGRHDAAARALGDALDIAQRLGNPVVECPVLSARSRLGRSTGDHEESLRYARDAVDLARGSGLSKWETEGLNTLGEAECAAGMKARAVATHDEALALARRTREPYEEARALRGLGLALEDRFEASGRLREALKVFQRLGVPQADDVRAELAALDGDATKDT
jgi:tetratricopeptide (TPR) repeat protein/transcriptional regulator with XRE-family HTH domain